MSAAQPGCLHGMLLLYGNASTSFITKAPEVFGFQGSAFVVHFRHYHNNIYAYAMLGQGVPTLFWYNEIV